MKKIILGLFAILLAIVYSCNDNESSQGSSTGNSTSDKLQSIVDNIKGSPVKATILVMIEDENGEPMRGASVSIGNQTYSTNKDGLAFLEKVSTFKNFAYIKATKTGYLDGSRTLMSVVANNSVTIKMYPLKNAQIIDANTGGKVSIQTPYGAASVTFQGGFIDVSNNKPYTGPVSVFVNYLDPLASDTRSLMPGELFAINSQDKTTSLKSFGMENVELRGSNGQELQITNDAEIKIPINPKQFSSANQNIPMWYFDEKVGVWVESGIGHMEGRNYVANVSHFTWWNWDVCTEGYIWYTLYVKNAENGEPLAGVPVDIMCSTGHGGSETNSMGDTAGPVAPGNLTLHITNPQTNEVEIVEVGAYESNTTDTVYLNLESGEITVENGSILSHEGKGFIKYSIDGGEYITDDIHASGYIRNKKLFIGASRENGNETNIMSASSHTGEYGYGVTKDKMYISCLSTDGISQGWKGSPSPDISFNVTNIGEVGESIELSFEGSYHDYAGNVHEINGSARVKRLE